MLYIDIIGGEREEIREKERERTPPHLAMSCVVTIWAETDGEVQCGWIVSVNTPTIAVDTAC